MNARRNSTPTGGDRLLATFAVALRPQKPSPIRIISNQATRDSVAYVRYSFVSNPKNAKRKLMYSIGIAMTLRPGACDEYKKSTTKYGPKSLTG